MKKSPKGRGPLFITVALIFAAPICIAESAHATSFQGSSFQRPSATAPVPTSLYYGQSLWLQSQSGSTHLLQNQPRTNPSSRLLASSLPSLEDINNLEFTLSNLKTQLNLLKSKKVNPTTISNIESQISDLETAIQDAKDARTSYERAQATLKTLLSDLEKQKSTNETLLTQKTTAQAELEAKKLTLTEIQAIQTTAQASLAETRTLLSQAQTELDAYNTSMIAQTEVKNQAQENLTARQEAFVLATADLETASQQLAIATQELQQAQHNYDNNLIPDPDWTAPTYQKENIRTVENTRTVEVRTQVPTTTTTLQEQVIPNLLFNSDFSRSTEGWSGVNPGWQGSNPALIDGEIIFSYQNQTVSQGLFSGPFQNATLTLSADWFNNDSNTGRIDNYSMTIEAKDINQNTVGSATYNSTGAHDWENKSVTLTATGPVSYITVSFTGVDSGFWYGVYGPHVKNPVLQVSHGQMVTETTYEEVITYEEETYYTYETYYTTELVKTEGTLNVKINEGGQATFNAPAGATFTSSNLRYESINNPTCGRNIAPNINGLSSITIQALNSVWGDPCGGQYKHITGTISYLGAPTAPLIKDPALLPILQQKQAAFTEAQTSYDAKLSTKNSLQELKTSAEATLLTEMQELDAISTSYEAKQATVQDIQVQEQQAVSQVTEATTNVEVASSNVVAAEQTFQAASTLHEESTTQINETEDQVTEAKKIESTSLNVAAQTYTQASQKASTTSNEIEAIPEEGSQELPAEITADSLLETDLTQVDPTEMTPEQAEELKEAALEVFETAVEGSPEYEQALDALYLAAEQDDIVLDPSLAAIPGLAAATELVNFFGNAGSDMSPKTREESEKIVVTAVVAAGAAVQAAASAATTASAPSGGSRRIGK